LSRRGRARQQNQKQQRCEFLHGWKSIIKAMYRVQYLCPRQSPNWQTSKSAYNNLQAAVAWCHNMKPPRGKARVIDLYGRVVYSA
jgi:hypothetical protein